MFSDFKEAMKVKEGQAKLMLSDSCVNISLET